MNGADYKEFDDADYTRFRRSLLRAKGSPRQRSFLMAVRSNREFLGFIREDIATNGSRETPLCSERLTENEFKDPPASTETVLYTIWAELRPRLACRTTFWASVTCRHIENEKIDAVYLAANGGTQLGGAERIDRALQGDGADAAKPIDDCVRTVLRRLSGLPDARGNRTVYVDCPLARAWWRERLVAGISQGDKGRADRVREVARVNQAYWEELVILVVSRNSILGSHEVRDAFILALAGLLAREPNTPLRTAKELRLACRAIGVMQASRELSVLDTAEIHSLLNGIVEAQHRKAVARRED